MARVFRKIRNTIGRWGLLLAFQRGRCGAYKGIGISVVKKVSDVRAFARLVTEALALIDKVDERRFRRVARHIRWIVAAPHPRCAGGARYVWQSESCEVEFPWSGISGGQAVIRLAGIIVFVATSALLWQSSERWKSRPAAERVKALCKLEEKRFLERARRVDR